MSENSTKTTVLVTGFGPFGDHQVNASWETVKLLSKKGLGDGIDLIIYEIPVEYETVKKVVPTFWDKHKPDLVLHTGVSEYVSKFTLEQHAHNNGYSTLDVKGCPAVGSCCIVGEEDILVSGIDMVAICEQMNKAEIAVKTDVSYLDCGRYLCDFSYFTSLHINRNRCAFIHVPPLDNPYSVEELAEGLKAAILAMLKQLGL